MAQTQVFVALALLAAVQPAMATQPDPAPAIAAPEGTPDTRYCLRVGPLTGSLAETIACMTRAEWAEQDVDVDKEWAKEGVRTIG